ncbi:M23 family metallopeptidase [Dyadobacter tibetensis]|uniref:M23 family metallopeptidase n=1 Tax=Dyadobacter tibetensis TaxID=1211851 RepID=UPI0004B064D0|nr:M23 family metallopeptidase [Dyadobacter tibetensis]
MLRHTGTLLSSIFIGLLILLMGNTAQSQRLTYPKGYYQFPIRPGLSNSLSGGLGDLRTNHFHAGTDIRTQQREGLPVHAAAQGYVYKIGVQRGGYGNVIYLRHPNGQTTVYGHLKVFGSKIADYVRRNQYAKRTFEIDLYPPTDSIVFKKGEVIALSGNTGGSAGPHLHFEIRDSKDNYINPLFFDFKEIIDNAPPKFVKLALRPLSIDSRINGRFDRKEFTPIRQKDGSYQLPGTITGTGAIGIDLQAFDQMTGTGFRYGLQCIEVKVDGKEIFSYNMEIFPNAATRDYNNLIDYSTQQERGERYLRCYVPDGNQFNLYKTDEHKGRLMITDSLTHTVQVTISDSYQNASELVFRIKGEAVAPPMPSETSNEASGLTASIEENVYKIEAPGYQNQNPEMLVYRDGLQKSFTASAHTGAGATFLLDLRRVLPDSVRIGKHLLRTDFQTVFLPGIPQRFQKEDWYMVTDSSSLFDTLYVRTHRKGQMLTVNDPGVALRHYIQLGFKPDFVPANKDKSHIYRYKDGNYSFIGGEWSSDGISFRTRELGSFVIKTDSIPPKLRVIEQSKSRIAAYIQDNDSGIKHFNAEVNGAWVLLLYDYKTGMVWSDKLDENEDFEGELIIEVTDRAGNSTILQTEIKEKTNSAKKRK